MSSPATSLLGLAAVFVSAAAIGQTLDEVLERSFGASKGRARIASVHAERLTGEISLRGQQRGPLVIERKRTGLVRVEVDLPRGTFVAGFDGETAWQINPAISPGRRIPLPLPIARVVAEVADIDGPLGAWRRSGIDFRLAGREVIDGIACLRVESLAPDGSVRSLLVESRTGRVLEWRGTLGIRPRSPVYEIRFSDWSDTDGIAYPTCVTAGRAGERPRIVIDLGRLVADPQIGDEWFSGP